jgi:hypothetical protein
VINAAVARRTAALEELEVATAALDTGGAVLSVAIVAS